MTTLRADLQEISRSIRVLFRTGDVVEMRVPKTSSGKGTISGYFNDFDKLAKALAAPNGNAPGVYMTLHPVKPALLARAANRIRERTPTRTGTSDKDIDSRWWLLVDCDPIRPAEISATDAEHEAALDRARDIRMVFGEEGWPAPILADSGNGGHLLYALELPNDEVSTKLLEAVLKALAARFDDDHVQIDQSVFNASRIVKAYGTVARKGDNISERPHRISRILEIPPKTEPVSSELLQELASTYRASVTPRHTRSFIRSRFSIEAFLARLVWSR